jgi:hypothetical protein
MCFAVKCSKPFFDFVDSSRRAVVNTKGALSTRAVGAPLAMMLFNRSETVMP